MPGSTRVVASQVCRATEEFLQKRTSRQQWNALVCYEPVSPEALPCESRKIAPSFKSAGSRSSAIFWRIRLVNSRTLRAIMLNLVTLFTALALHEPEYVFGAV